MQRQRHQNRCAARTAAHHHHARCVREAALRKVLCATDRILAIHLAPRAAQLQHVRPAIAGAAAVVKQQHGIAARRKKLHIAVKTHAALRGWSAVADDNGRRRRAQCTAHRCVIQPMRQLAASALPADRLCRSKLLRQQRLGP